MTWNWQKQDWPDFSWNDALLRNAEERFLLEAGMFVGAVKHLSPADHEQLVVEALSVEAVTTSEIEGETLDRASVQFSIRKQLGFAGDGYNPDEAQGILRRTRRGEQEKRNHAMAPLVCRRGDRSPAAHRSHH
jgi:Fic family protein